MRWADMDLLGHVNNVVYVDYLQEARVDMLRTHGRSTDRGDLAEGVVVVHTDVTYLAPLVFEGRPVHVECWVTEIRAASFTLAYEIFQPGPDGARTVHTRATTVLTPYVFEEERPRRLTPEERATLTQYLEAGEPVPRVQLTPRRDEVGHFPVQVRFSDVDVFRHVNNVKYFEYVQEARISYLNRLWRAAGAEPGRSSLVIARVEVDYRVPMLHRPAPYDAWSWISRVGSSSFVVQTEILDGDRVLARAQSIGVFFDGATQRATRPDPVYRDALVAALAADAGTVG